MRFGSILTLTALVALGSCATGQGMQHGAMSHEEMARHCAMMEQHQSQGEGAAGAHQHDPAQHDGMSHEEMARHCAMMREQQQQPVESQPHQH